MLLPAGKRCIIYSWSPTNPATAKVIADGIFLNFSTTNPVQASLIENLLFFTDNRNQPRKVNTTIEDPNGILHRMKFNFLLLNIILTQLYH